jgi:UDP-GlcNAc3NAcA epimerase
LLKLLTVIGARPQFVKAAVVSRALNNLKCFEEVIVHTGQHFDSNMSAIFFDELAIPKPSYNLNIGGGSHGMNTGRMLESLEAVLQKERPDLVLVYGDTDSTLAGALAATKLSLPVAHIEAGLRSFNKRMPEEINRIATDHMSSLLFTPSATANANLAREGISGKSVQLVGDVMHDAALTFAEVACRRSRIVETLGLADKKYILATIHRKENTDDAACLREIFLGLSQSKHLVVLPLHPRTQKRLSEFDITCSKNIMLIEPVGYLDMIQLECAAMLIATDSGGVQKEAYFHGVPCITLREETEWVELIALGVNCLVGANSEAIARRLAQPPAKPPEVRDLYGDGHSAERIAELIKGFSK